MEKLEECDAKRKNSIKTSIIAISSFVSFPFLWHMGSYVFDIILMTKLCS